MWAQVDSEEQIPSIIRTFLPGITFAEFQVVPSWERSPFALPCVHFSSREECSWVVVLYVLSIAQDLAHQPVFVSRFADVCEECFLEFTEPDM